MPAVQETIDQVRQIDVDQYKYGFETLIEMDKAPKGLNEDIIRFISAKKEEPEWMLEWRLDAYERWLTMEEPSWARVDYPKIDFNDIHYYAAPKNQTGPKTLDEVDPELAGDLREAGHSAARAGNPGRCAGISPRWLSMPCSIRFRSSPPSRKTLAKAGVIFMSISEAIRDAPGTGPKKYPRLGRAGERQLLCHAELAVFHGRVLCLRAEGRALPDGTVDLFPHQ